MLKDPKTQRPKMNLYPLYLTVRLIFSMLPVAASLVKDPKTQRPKGFGFVSYESEMEARRAMNAMNARVTL